MMDDLGYGDLGSYGAPDARTPNVDRLARPGVRLTEAYANGHVCSPTRAALISGRYPQRSGIERALADVADSAVGLPVTGTSLPSLLKTNGYATGLIGKWHLGFRREFRPQAHGFDEFFGFLSGAHDYYLGNVFDDTTRVPLTGYLTDEITTRALRFIERHAADPFFLEQRGRRQRAVRSGRWKLLVDGAAIFLFDLERDPGERRDLAAQRPDKVALLKQLSIAWSNDVNAQAPAR